MILNVETVVAFFLASVGALLAAATVLAAVAAWWPLRRRDAHHADDLVGSRAYLVELIVATLGLVRFVAWPHFYLLMHSYVPTLEQFGVMCVFGVTRIEPDLVRTLQIAKPVVLLLIGLWWAMTLVDRRSNTPALLSPRMLLAVLLGALALFECAAEASYLIREKVGQRVTCCTQFLGTEAVSVPTAMPWSDETMASAAALGGGYLALGALMVGLCIVLGRRGLPQQTFSGFLLAAAALVAGTANLLLTHWTWLQVLAPKVLQLPYHHCVYELLTETPALGLAAMMTIAGNASLLWPALLQLLRKRAPQATAAVQRQIYQWCAVALASALIIVGVHLV